VLYFLRVKPGEPESAARRTATGRYHLLLVIAGGISFSLVWLNHKAVSPAATVTTPTTPATLQVTTVTPVQIPTGTLVLDDPLRDTGDMGNTTDVAFSDAKAWKL